MVHYTPMERIICVFMYLYIYIYTHIHGIFLWISYAWNGTWDICVYIYILCLKSNYVLLCMEYFLHLGNFDGTCREIFHTWSI